MSNDLKECMETMLQDSKSKTAVAIKVLSQSLDLRFTEMKAESEKKHKEILDAIKKNREETDLAMKGIEVVRFFSAHPKWLGIIVSCLLILVGAGAENIWKSLFK